MILIQLALYFGLLSLLTFGGLSSVIPEMQRYIVDVKGWITPTDFMQLFAVSQAAPFTAAGMLATRLNPLWLLAGGGVLGGFLLSMNS